MGVLEEHDIVRQVDDDESYQTRDAGREVQHPRKNGLCGTRRQRIRAFQSSHGGQSITAPHQGVLWYLPIDLELGAVEGGVADFLSAESFTKEDVDATILHDTSASHGCDSKHHS